MDGFSSLAGSSPPAPSGPSSEDEVKKVQDDQMRRDLMATILDSAARERLSRIALVSPERSKQIESILVRMVQSGQIRGRMSEEQLINLLDQMEQVQGKSLNNKPAIVYQRRKGLDEDDFDF
ncbi:PDCD5-related protein [Cyathus striatus]|nr:PDCD5-related protein [Cyathus striatus]